VYGAYRLGYDIESLRTLTFVVIVFGNQATTYNNRERGRLWGSRPSLWLAASSMVDIGIASTLAVGGIAMRPLPAWLVAATLAAAVIFAFLLDLIKVPLFARLGFAPSARPA
jgi:H+-transporting ATPase